MRANNNIIKFLISILIICLYSCGPNSVLYKYEFSGRTDPLSNNKIKKSKKYNYSFQFGKNDDLLIEKNILFHIGSYLNSIGWNYVENPAQSDILIDLKYSIRDSEKKFTKVVKTGTQQVVATNWDGTAKKDSEGNIKYKNRNIYGTEERTRQGYTKEYNITLLFKDEVAWSADISSFGKDHDLVRVSERIFPKILKKNFLKDKSKTGRLKLYIGCTDPDASNYCEKCDILDLKECKY